MSDIEKILKLQNELNFLVNNLKNEIINEIMDIPYPTGITKISKNSFSVKFSATNNILSPRYYHIDKQKELIISNLNSLNSINDINKFFKNIIELKKIEDRLIHDDLINFLTKIIEKYLNENKGGK